MLPHLPSLLHHRSCSSQTAGPRVSSADSDVQMEGPKAKAGKKKQRPMPTRNASTAGPLVALPTLLWYSTHSNLAQ